MEQIESGKAPPAIKLAAARGMLPLTNEDMLEVLVTLGSDESEDIRAAAASTIETFNPELFADLASDKKAPPGVLGFLCMWSRAPREMVEAAIFNLSTPDAALARLAVSTQDTRVIEAISLKQQSLIRSPEIIEAILANPNRTPDAERRALEVRAEFFEKQFGARLIAEEQRVREEAEEAARHTVVVEGIEDLVRLGLIEEGIDDEIDDSIIAEYEAEYGPFDSSPPSQDQQINITEMIGDMESENEQGLSERMPVFQQIALMSIKDRVMLAIKGTRDARLVLVRDPNRVVASAVLRNPRLTETEIENISSIRTVPEDVLRQIGQNRVWTRSYTVIHNLVRNPRTPIAIGLGFLNRIQTRDLRALSKNKNVPDVIRSTSFRLFNKRGGM